MKSLFNRESLKRNIVFVAIWGIVIVTGFLALGAFIGGIESLVVFGRVHSLAVRAGLVYTAFHIFQHRTQIMLCFGIGNEKSDKLGNTGIICQFLQCNRAVRAIAAIALHILLHMVSIDLAIAYTVVHIVQHRHEISSLFKKLSFNHNTQVNHDLQAVTIAVVA